MSPSSSSSPSSADARNRIFARIREGLGRTQASALQARREVAAYAEAPPPLVIPARGQIVAPRLVDAFLLAAQEVAATVERIASVARVPHGIADHLTRLGLPPEAHLAPETRLAAIPWERRPTLVLRRGLPEPGEVPPLASVTGAFAGIAETGTVMLVSGPQHPPRLNLLPEAQIVVLWSEQIVGCYEEAWSRLQAEVEAGERPGPLPATVMLVTGPSRTGDVEMTLQKGAHGPRHLHIILVDGGIPGDGGDGVLREDGL